MTTPAHSSDLLTSLLAEEGCPPDAPRARTVWVAFQRFLEVPIACDDSDFLCQWGTYTLSPDTFEFDLTRQFGFADGLEVTGLQQLHCTLTFPAIVGQHLEADALWGSDFPTSEAFFAYLIELPVFAAVMAAGPAQSLVIALEDLTGQS